MAGFKAFATYPPSVTKAEVLGPVTDASGIFHSRDIGVPFHFAGHTHLIFGDTFCNNSNNEFVGLVSNTAAIVEDCNRPTQTRYLDVERNGKVMPFIPLTRSEKRLQRKGRKTRFTLKTLGFLFATLPGIEDGLKKVGGIVGKRNRVTLWAFGGAVDLDDGSGQVWFAKNVYHGQKSTYIGTGTAKITPHLSCDGNVSIHRTDDVVFGPDEPHNGTFSTIVDGDYVYLYGDAGHNDIILARINRHADMTDKSNYTYWNGNEYVSDPKAAVTVLHSMCQGSVVRSKLFGPDKPFLFVGVDQFADSNIEMAASASLEGPWLPKAIYKASGIKEKAGFMYCVYPHVWASNEEAGELVVSWSEGYPGGVIMARLTFAPPCGGGM